MALVLPKVVRVQVVTLVGIVLELFASANDRTELAVEIGNNEPHGAGERHRQRSWIGQVRDVVSDGVDRLRASGRIGSIAAGGDDVPDL